MARIAGVPAREPGLLVKLAYRFTRPSIARLTGREPERMIEPLELFAHAPGLLLGYAMLEWATAKLDCVDERLKNLAGLKAATLTHCESRGLPLPSRSVIYGLHTAITFGGLTHTNPS